MAEGAATPQSIIIKKVKKGGHGGAHSGGAWKIAYADFVTAMMAFFLLLWLLNSISQESLEGLSNYFAPVSVSTSTSGSGGVLGGKVISEDGAGTSSSGQISNVTMDLPAPKAGTGGDVDQEVTEDAAKKALEDIENEQFEEAQQEIEEKIKASAELSELKNSLIIENTPEGLQIQLVDQDGLPLFASGKSEMLPHTLKLIHLVAGVILTMPQQLSISGHTDSVPFNTATGYSNWELSSDRANAARRALMDESVPFDRVSRVVGKAETQPLLPDDPTNARNRRLSIILLRGTTEGPGDGQESSSQESESLPGLNAIKQKQHQENQQNQTNGGASLDLEPIPKQTLGN